MEETPRPDSHQAADDAELMSLVELQKFLADELAATDSESSFTRAFLPLTDGLGLESPKRPSVYAPEKEVIPGKSAPPQTPRPEIKKANLPPAPEIKVKAKTAASATHKELGPLLSDEALAGLAETKEPAIDRERVLKEAVGRKEIAPLRPRPALDTEEMPPVDPLIAPKVTPVVPAAEEKRVAAREVAVPPPMPAASWFRRAQAAVVDQVLVLGMWVGALVITSNSLSRSADPLVTRLLHDFTSMVFLRYAALELAAIWFGYLALCLGIMGMTIGMWVWGLRVSFGGERRGLKKLARIFFSLLLLAPMLPSLVLIIRIRGRNLLDLLSGTSLYRTVG